MYAFETLEECCGLADILTGVRHHPELSLQVRDRLRCARGEPLAGRQCRPLRRKLPGMCSEWKSAAVNELTLFQMTNIHQNPSSYLNGTGLPLNVTGFELQCPLSGSPCTPLGSPDSFMWYDELHPTEQVDRVIAREFVNVISGNSTYATYYKPTSPGYDGRW